MKSLVRQLSISAGFVLVVAGCTNVPSPTAGPLVTPAVAGLPAAKIATVTIYRPRKLIGSALRPTVLLNGRPFVTVTNGKVFHARLAPGNYRFQVEDQRSGADVDMKAGESYFIRIDLEPGLFVGNGVMTLVAPQQGSFEAKGLDPLSKDNINNEAFR